MKKVLIVDDEVYIRKGIISTIQWEQLGLELAGEAEDGLDALSKIPQYDPDIVIMDMMMPGMNGIGLIHRLKQEYPRLKIIVLSAYSDFEYTREAIVNHAFDYILKPLKSEELNHSLARSVEELNRDHEEERIRENSLQPVFEKWILGGSEEGVSDEVQALLQGRFHFPEVTCCMIKADAFLTARTVGSEEPLMAIKKAAEQWLETRTEGCIVFLSHIDRAVVALFSMKTGTDIENTSQLLLQEMVDSLVHPLGFSISVGYCAGAETILELPVVCTAAADAVMLKSLSQTGKVIGQKEFGILSTRARISEKMLPEGSRKLLVNAVKTGTFEKAMEHFRGILEEAGRKNLSVHGLYLEMILLLGDLEKELGSLGTSMDGECGRSSIACMNELNGLYSSGEIEEFLKPVLHKLCMFYSIRKRMGGRKIVDEILGSINHQYNKQISLADYSKQYFVNVDYLGRIFKSETGKSFADYLTGFRIDQAKELIDSNRCSHYYEIANSVGYEDYSYFCKVFKSVTGLSPGEYKDRKRAVEQDKTVQNRRRD